ncbi:MAG: helix-turn-helix transcriptional regulator [Planctomycetaceae bacterium]
MTTKTKNENIGSLNSQNALELRSNLRRLIRIIERDDLSDESRQACRTIHRLLANFENPASRGLNIEECEQGAIAKNPALDRFAGRLDMQESVFWHKVDEILKGKAITQTQLASRMGLTQPAVSQMLNRRCRPQRATIIKFAEALGVKPLELWPDLETADILDTIAAVQEDQKLSAGEAEAMRRALKRSPSNERGAPLPKRKK